MTFCEGSDRAYPAEYHNTGPAGMTKREEFASRILAGFAAGKGDTFGGKQLAKHSVEWADDLIEALNK